MNKITKSKTYANVYVRTASAATFVTMVIVVTGAGRKFR